jgi:hypothetical protein
MSFKSLSFLLLALFFVSCSDKTLAISPTPLPSKDNSITLYPLENFTDTPQAGMRATNIVQGILEAKGYTILPLKEEQEASTPYYIKGAVSEWRYKTGIDGEPAVSLRLGIYDTKTKKLLWSATGANNDWGNSSIGTTAQMLIEDMLQ